MPTIIKAANGLALLFDGYEGHSHGHMRRNIGLAWMKLPLKTPE